MTGGKQPSLHVMSQDKMKIYKPPQICTLSRNNPVPKDEGSHDQWEFQVRGVMATHMENSVWATMVNSLPGPARDLVRFIRFDVDLERIREEINRFGRK